MKSVVWIFLLLAYSASCDNYTSSVDMEKLLAIESIVIETVEIFITKIEKRITELKREMDRYKEEEQRATKNITEYLNDPLNSFILIRRLLAEWDVVENFLSENILQELKESMTEIDNSLKYPTVNDLTGAVDSLNRIQKTYDVSVTSLTNGNINGVQYTSQLSAEHCYDIGWIYYIREDFLNSILWMAEALNRLEETSDENNIFKADILELMAFSTYKLGDFSKALSLTDELLEISPNNTRALQNKQHYIMNLEESTDYLGQKDSKPETVNPSEPELFALTCKRAVSPPLNITSQLKCSYITNDVPFLRLAPIKEEEVYLNPRIVLFKEVLYDSEIEIIKELSSQKLESALVFHLTEGVLSDSRVGKLAWISENEHTKLTAVEQRVKDMTKLSTATAEPLQVVNYGVGGLSEPHFDFAEETKLLFKEEEGNRMATLLFYMNDVHQGGKTVFPKLRLTLLPEKGSAALWFNLHPDGQGDNRTMHGACPVIAGSKWICTKWLHEIGQEFKRPCELKQTIVNENDNL